LPKFLGLVISFPSQESLIPSGGHSVSAMTQVLSSVAKALGKQDWRQLIIKDQ